MKKIVIIAAALAALGLALSTLRAQEADGAGSAFSEERASVYGYATSLAALDLRELPSEESELGGIAYLRLKADFKPQPGLSFHAEASYDARAGYQNQAVAAMDSGLPLSGLLDGISVDQAYMSVVGGSFSLQAGKVPLGWGSAYVFNPTQRASRPALLDPVVEETPGTLAIAPSWAPADELRLSAYAAFQDKSHRESVAAADGRIENLPFGLKAQTTIGSFDVAACLVKEVDYVENPLLGTAGYERALFAGLDAAGAIWDFGLYAEAALRLPTGDDGLSWEPEGFEILEALELAAGLDYMIPLLDVELRAEYYRQGSGTSDPSLYSPLGLLDGSALLQAEDYLFARLERVFADYLSLSVGALVNLDDGGFVAMAELSYEAMDNLEWKLGATLPRGPEGSEFEGRYDLSGLGLGELDFMRTSIYASCTMSF